MPELRLTDNARRVLEARYLLRDHEGELCEAPGDLFARVPRSVARAELAFDGSDAARRWEASCLERLTALEFLPNSPTLMNAGAPLGQLSGCFVLPVPDQIDGIFQALKEMAVIQQSGGAAPASRFRGSGRGTRSFARPEGGARNRSHS